MIHNLHPVAWLQERLRRNTAMVEGSDVEDDEVGCVDAYNGPALWSFGFSVCFLILSTHKAVVTKKVVFQP